MSHLQIHWFKNILSNSKTINQLKKVSLIVTDIDGSLTDGSVDYNEQGEADRAYSPQDGYAIRMATNKGLKIAFLSGNAGGSIISRAKKLQIPENLVILGSRNKCLAVEQFQSITNIPSEQTLIFGDDIIDAVVKENDPKIFFAMPNNGIFYLKHLADCIIPINAGEQSAFRLLLDLILYVQDKHDTPHLIKQALESCDEKNNCCDCSCAA